MRPAESQVIGDAVLKPLAVWQLSLGPDDAHNSRGKDCQAFFIIISFFLAFYSSFTFLSFAFRFFVVFLSCDFRMSSHIYIYN